MRRILIATSNAGKLRDFAGAAARHGVEISGVPDFASLPAVVEDGDTFEDNARKKAEGYSRHVPREIVVATIPAWKWTRCTVLPVCTPRVMRRPNCWERS